MHSIKNHIGWPRHGLRSLPHLNIENLGTDLRGAVCARQPWNLNTFCEENQDLKDSWSQKKPPCEPLTCGSFFFDLLQFGECGCGQHLQIHAFLRLKELG